MEDNDIKQFKLRLTPELYDWVAEDARRNHRSMNAQFIYITETYRSRVERAREPGLVENTKFNQ